MTQKWATQMARMTRRYRAMFLPRITEMDGRGGLFVEVAGGVEGFKHQINCVLLRMISEVLNICDRVMKGALDFIEMCVP